ncbi:TauD/TfdA family dioxygenase [Streptomyces sp. SL13]|uniref:TauD/TfdA family dioxygenase n=1 Tax=Streptantibioticus silvisoli TaxID=2705255 RepID=A0AA90HCL1_9ACTN|nr:TauD/TfdA family dioxygenase [Streptantibioticus silvisoli]MDI5973877.1 TauD/TfdA family dioxygenase [Streptantibioticus silvisoli]
MRLEDRFGNPLSGDDILPALDAQGIIHISAAERTTIAKRLSSLWRTYPHPHAGDDGWTDIRADGVASKGSNAKAFTTSALPPHTDRSLVRHPPALLCFLLVADAASGGEITLVDTKTIYQRFSSAELSEIYRSLWLNDSSGNAKQPLLSLHRGLLITRYRNDHIASPKAASQSAAALLGELERARSLAVPKRLRPGDGYLIHNYRILHGRTEFFGARRGVRFLGSVDEGSPYAFLNSGFRIHQVGR